MLLTWLFEAIAVPLIAILEALPDLELETGDYVDDFAVLVGNALGGLDGILPITEMAVVVGWIFTAYLPVWLAYVLARWVYTHIPVIGNGG